MKLSHSVLFLVATLTAGLVTPEPARATDGRIQISQTAATTGRLAGDAPGFPITIASSGSYVLVSDLDLTGELNPQFTTAIEITADWVTLDMGGHTIKGTNNCTTTSTSSEAGSVNCTYTANGDAIYGLNQEGVSVRNGSISGMGRHGVILGDGATVESVTVRHGGGTGIYVGDGSRVHDVAMQDLAANGVTCWGPCRVSNARIVTTGGDGIYGAFSGSDAALLVDASSVRYASDAAVQGSGYMLVHNTNAWVNGRGFVSTSKGMLVDSSTAYESNTMGFEFENGTLLHGNSALNNDGDGYHMNGSSRGVLILENVARGNSGYPLYLTVQQPYGLNVFSSNPLNGYTLESNVCGSNTSC